VSGSSRVLILGAQGQLGIELQRAFADTEEIVAYARDLCDFSKPETIRKTIASVRPDLVLNAAAYTAVDRAESEPELAMSVNGEAPGVIAEETRKLGALLVHYSTDYVFDGSKNTPWIEEDPTNPLSEYGKSKLAGERNIEQAGGRYLIFRTSWVFSPHGNNFLRTMLRLGQERERLNIVNDQTGAPTSAEALAKATRQAVDSLRKSDDRSGMYHMTCAGSTTWCGFAEAIFRKSRVPGERPWPIVAGIPTEGYPTPARRPKNSVLSNQKLLDQFGVALPDWDLALEDTLRVLDLLNEDQAAVKN
jgi:dTDP-4-dehydrorhamnose reductase